MAEAKKTTRARTTRAKAAAKPAASETVKALVLKTFIDRHTGERVEEGTVIDVTPERLAEIEGKNPNLVSKQ